MIRLHLDYETYSNADIKKVGGYRYAADPSTEILMASYAFDDRPPVLWDATVDPEVPKDLMAAFLSPEVELHAFNAAFERQITRHVLGLHIPTSRWFCTMVRAWALGFSGGLAAVGEQIGLSPDKQKLSEGSKLINRFCKPAPSNRKADRYTRHTHPEEWNRFCQYCVQDTVAEREMEDLLVGYPTIPQERDLWLLDQDVNDRGLPIDLALVQGAVEIRDAEIIKLKREMNDITGLKNANSPAQLLKWLDEQGAPQPDMTKDSVARTLSVPTIPTPVREVLQCRQQASKTSVKKWDALLAATTDDGRLRGAFQFGGAQRTQRWAGRIFQPQNLPRPSRKDIDVVAGWLALRDRDLVEVIFGDVMGFLSDTIRAAITSPEGKELVVCDLGSIESRVLGWESGCTRINQTFARGFDTYKDFATELFGVTYDEVTEHQRFVSKPPTLGCGYRLGADGLMAYAESMGVTMSYDEAKHAVDTYRSTYPEVPEMWAWYDEAMRAVIDGGGTREGYAVQLSRDDNFLFLELCSGRRIAYYKPLILDRTPPWGGKPRPTITYMGMNQRTRKWERLSTHGGMATEQATQGLARDILGYHMTLVEREYQEFTLVGHVHDEVITEVQEGQGSRLVPVIEGIMSTTPPWAPGMLLGAKGFNTKRYKKD